MAKKKLTLEDVLVPKEEIPYEVPGNWCWTRLKFIIDKINYGYTESATMEEVGPKFLRITDIKENGVDWNTVPYCTIEDKNYEKYKLNKGDIVVARTGATTGKNYIIEDDVEAVFASYLIRFSLNKEINHKYVSYFMKTQDYWNQIMEERKGIAQPGVNAQKLSNILIPLPPLAEQKRIVNRIESLFDKVDKASELVDEARDGFEKRRAAILERAFSGELTNSIPRHIKLKECGKFITDKKEPEKEDYYLGLEHFGSGYGIIGGSSGEDVKSTKGKFKKGDILYGRLRPYLDKHDIVDRDGICSTDILIFRCDDEVSINKYINYFMGMNDFKSYAMENSKGINLPRVSAKVLEELVIPIFTVEEQIKIVTILDNLFSKEIELSDITNIDDNIELIKKSILANAFRGELGSNDLNDKSSIELIETLI